MNISKYKITRLYTGEDGHTHFEDLDGIDLFHVGNTQKISKEIPNAGIQIYEFGKDFFCDWHLTTKPCYFIYLAGEQEIEIKDGTRRRFGVGDILLAEDTYGSGHLSQSVGETDGRALIVLL